LAQKDVFTRGLYVPGQSISGWLENITHI